MSCVHNVLRAAGLLFLGLFSFLMLGDGEPVVDALLEKAHGLYKQKDYPDAVKAYTKAIEAEPKDPKRYMFRGLAASMTGDWKACIADLDKGIELDPKGLELLATRAFARLQTDEFELAVKDFVRMDEVEKDAGKKARFGLAQRILRRARNNLMSKDGRAMLFL